MVGVQQKPTPDPKSEKTIFGKEHSRWAARDYAVRASVVHDVITNFGVQPTWDALPMRKINDFPSGGDLGAPMVRMLLSKIGQKN